MERKQRISAKILYIMVACILVATVIFACFYGKSCREYQEEASGAGNGETIVALNEIRNLMETDNTSFNSNGIAKEKVDALIEDLQNDKAQEREMMSDYVFIFYLLSVGFIIVLFVIVYVVILRPFEKLEDFAADIAAGNLDRDLKYNRINLFGEFTWAFDHMRREIKKARACEQEAVENNKTVIATLSHDIKTPIASIRAYAEGLSENMDSTPERRNRYLNVIMKKCDEVTKITNDMFIHSLHNLDKLVIKKEEVVIHKVIADTVEAMDGNKGDIRLGDIKEAVIPDGDSGRIAQAIENIINNARKYAKGNIYIHTEKTENEYILSIKDSGKGIPPEDMPFIFEKFYRGRNHGEEPGSGLGLFIVQYIMQQMNGRVELLNHADGLEVKLYFKIN